MAKLHGRVPKFPYSYIGIGLVSLLAAVSAGAQDEANTLEADAPAVQRLAALAAELGESDRARREDAREALTSLGIHDLPAIRARIARIRRTRPPRRWSNDILNRFRRRGRREDGGPADLVVGAMAELEQDHKIPRERLRVVLMAEPVMLWAALDQMNSLQADRVAFGLIGLDDGLWMPEARNWLRRNGRSLVAAALYARRDGDRFVRRWGRFAYEETGADHPGRVIPDLDAAVLPDVLRAYADARIQGAMRVVVSYTGHRRRAVRRAARQAMRTYGGAGIWALRGAYRNLTGEHPPREWGWERLSAALYDAHDAHRMAPVRSLLEAGLAARDRGDLDSSRRALDRLLARMPELEDPDPVASIYAELGTRAFARERLDEAEAHFRRALRLAPTHTDARRWQGHCALIDALRATGAGIHDEAAYQRVLALLPNQDAAEQAVRVTLPEPTRRRTASASRRTSWGVVAALLLGLLGLALLWQPTTVRHDRPEDFFDATLEETFDEGDTTLVDKIG